MPEIFYKANEILTKKIVAIKVINKDKIKNMNLFLKEFDILSRLDHPNIISVKEIW